MITYDSSNIVYKCKNATQLDNRRRRTWIIYLYFTIHFYTNVHDSHLHLRLNTRWQHRM